MNKIKNATKRITAIGASALMVSSAAFGAGLSGYPSNFVDNGKFTGQVVVGASAAAIDSTSAASIITDLKGEFSGNSEKVKISYKSASSGGEEFKIVDSSSNLNYGETIGDARKQKIDDTDMKVLSDGRFNNGADDEDYTQEVRFNKTTGSFEHSLRTSADQTDISDNIYINDNVPFFSYILDFNSPVTYGTGLTQSDIDNDFLGEDINILGTDFTISQFQTTNDILTKLELLGGANTISLGEGDSTTIEYNGKTFDVQVSSVSETTVNKGKVLLTINGETKSVDEFDTDTIGGINVAVTDVVASSRDAVKGYAEIVVGGQKMTFESGVEVQVNDNDISDEFPGYFATATIASTAGKWDKLTINYQADDELVLRKGEMFEDKIFNVLNIDYRGTNEPTFSKLRLDESGDQIDIDAITIDGTKYSDGLAVYDGTFDATHGYTLTGRDDAVGEDLMYVNGSVLAFDLTNNTNKGVRFLTGDKDDQYLWEIQRFDTIKNETDFKDAFKTSSTNDKVGMLEWETTLDGNIVLTGADPTDFNITGFTDSFAFENQRMLNLSAVDNSGTDFVIAYLDQEDTDVDTEGTDDNEAIKLTFIDDATDNKANINLDNTVGGILRPTGSKADISDSNNDVREYATKFGTIIREDRQDSEWVEIMTPDEQVEALVYLVAGSSSLASSVTVDKSAVDDKKTELEADGFTITGTEDVSSATVEFDVTAPVLDSDVTGMDNMIVVGGPAVNSVAAALLGMTYPTRGAASEVGPDEAVVRYFTDSESVLVYGYEGKDTAAAADKLNKGGLTGSLVNVG